MVPVVWLRILWVRLLANNTLQYIVCYMPVPATTQIHRRILLRNEVYDSLRDAIVTGTLAPGERLKDSELEVWLGVSRTPIREALLRLQRAGLVSAIPGRVTTVAPFDPAATLSAQHVVAALHELAARLAVPTITDAQLDEMASANDRFARALAAADVAAAIESDDAFHSTFVAESGNELIAELLEQVTPILHRVEWVRFASLGARDSVAQHARILRLARRRDADGTAVACRENWLSLRYTATE